MTRSEAMRGDVSALLRARHIVLWISTFEEARVANLCKEAAANAKFNAISWDCAMGTSDMAGKPINVSLQDPMRMLQTIGASPERAVYILKDLHEWLRDPTLKRQLRSLAISLQGQKPAEARAIIILAPSAEVPPELKGHVTVLEWPLPDRAEVASILDKVVGDVREDLREAAKPASRDAAIDAAVGLMAEEIVNCYSLSLVTKKTIDAKTVSAEKKRVVGQTPGLTYYDPDPRGLEAVGGLDLLKKWLIVRRASFTQRARERGCPPPKGAFFLGLPGCGKSLTAKAIASAYAVPLFRLDLGALSSKFLGESEGNIRRALAMAEAVSPCVVWIDEIREGACRVDRLAGRRRRRSGQARDTSFVDAGSEGIGVRHRHGERRAVPAPGAAAQGTFR